MAALFAVITVTRDNLRGLRRTKDSLDLQTCRDFEWIVIDGASGDGTADYLPATGARWISAPDAGIYDAMNKGLGLAQGDFVLFLNAGDALAAPDVLDRLRAFADADFIYGDAWEGGHYKAARPHADIAAGMFTHHQAMLYRRAAIGGLRYDTSYAIAADYKFTAGFMRLARKVAYAPLPVCLFEPGGISQRQALQGRREQYAVRRALGTGGLQNGAIFLWQSFAWGFRRVFPALYWAYKGRKLNRETSKNGREEKRKRMLLQVL